MPGCSTLLGVAGKRSFERGEAVHYQNKVRLLMDCLDRNDEFASSLERIRTGHWRKRNFMKLLDAWRWS